MLLLLLPLLLLLLLLLHVHHQYSSSYTTMLLLLLLHFRYLNTSTHPCILLCAPPLNFSLTVYSDTVLYRTSNDLTLLAYVSIFRDDITLEL